MLYCAGNICYIVHSRFYEHKLGQTSIGFIAKQVHF